MTTDNPEPDRRIGKFRISRAIINDHPGDALAVLSECIVLRADVDWHSNSVEYVALSDKFEHVPSYLEPPFYEAQITAAKVIVAPSVKWVKKPY